MYSFLMYSSLDTGKVKNKYMVTAYIHLFRSRVQLYSSILGFYQQRVINIYLKNSFYIDINKNIISYFNTWKLLFVILLPVPCKKMKHPLFLIHFGKRLEDKLWLGVGLSRCDRQTVVGRGVNLSLLRCLLCNRGVIV